jgi:hypothetical protein
MHADYVGESPLEPGRYRYVLDVRDDTLVVDLTPVGPAASGASDSP